METFKIGYFVGSLARGSINRTLANALIKLAPEDLEFTEIPIKDLPLYSYDYDADFPPAGRAPSRARTASCSFRRNTTAPSPARSRMPSTGDHAPGAPTPSPASPPASSALRRAASAPP
jgi:hypothetical protein